MIYIVDNGEAYSAHAIYFVEATEEEIEAALRICQFLHHGAMEIIGVTESISWRASSAVDTPAFLIPGRYVRDGEVRRLGDLLVSIRAPVFEKLIGDSWWADDWRKCRSAALEKEVDK